MPSTTKPELYFKTDLEWRQWLSENYNSSEGIYLIFYKIDTKIPSMRWEEAVKVALCYGWIDSTVKSLGDDKRRQYFCPRKPKSVWSGLNKRYIKELTEASLMHESGFKIIELGKQNGSWTALDEVEKGIIPNDLQKAFDAHPKAFENYQNFAPSYRKSYLYWLNQAKREVTRQNRIAKIVELCGENVKSQSSR